MTVDLVGATNAFDALPAISDKLKSAVQIGLFLDFDGTISPIVPSPAAAEMDPQIRPLLKKLVQRPEFVLIIVTGRAFDDVRHRVNIPGAIYVGNHGLEIEVRGRYTRNLEADALRPELRRLSLQLQLALADIQGVEIEDKGITLSVHFRRVESELHAWIVKTVVEAVERSPEFLTRPGKKVVEVRPRINVNKGTAIRHLRTEVLRASALPIYIGDDVTDEDAFAAIPEGITIKVGEPTHTQAHYVLPGVPDVARFLDWLNRTNIHGSLANGKRVGQ